MKKYLKRDHFFRTKSPVIKEFLNLSSISKSDSDVTKAVSLYYQVRDGVYYNPFKINLNFNEYSVIDTLKNKEGHCIDKACILITCLRSLGIPARLGLARVKNHMGTSKLEKLLNTDILVPHGYVEVYLNLKWVKCTPAFNKELCFKLNVMPLEWDGISDSQFQNFDSDKSCFMEYLEDYGTFSGIPQQLIIDLMKKEYPHLVINGEWKLNS